MDVRTSCAVALCVLSKEVHPVDREVLETSSPTLQAGARVSQGKLPASQLPVHLLFAPRKGHEKTRCHFEVTPGLPTFGSLVRPCATSDGDAQNTGRYGAHSRRLTRCISRIQYFVGCSALGTT